MRTRILDAAEELFAGSGYAATPTAVIAKLARVPGGLISDYFPRKIDVLVALIDERTHIEEGRDVDAVPGDPAVTVAREARPTRTASPPRPAAAGATWVAGSPWWSSCCWCW